MSNQLSRRKFIKTATVSAVGITVFPQFLTSCKQSISSTRKPNNGIIRMGFIGLGQQAMYLLNGFLRIPDVEVVAGSDVYGVKRERFQRRNSKKSV